MSRNMFALYYNHKASKILFGILRKNKKVKCLDECAIANVATNECVGRLFFIEGPRIFINVICKLDGMCISNGVSIDVVTLNDKIITEES